jgi:hypothetical protein
MRAIGTTLWVSAVLFELGACGPRVSLGDLGAGGAGGSGGNTATQGGASQGGAKLAGEGGRKVTGGGATQTSKAGGGNVSDGGAAVAQGGADLGQGGETPTGCPTAFDRFLPPVEVACPDTVPNDGAPCDVAENAICVFQTGIVGQGNVGYEVRGCYSSLEGNRWYGTGQGNAGPVGVDPQHCPQILPVAGTSCDGHAGEYCYYPEAVCNCPSDTDRWACEAQVKPNRVPAPVERLCVPNGVDEAKQIKDLSPAKITAWCQWYGGNGPRPPLSGIDTPGWANTYGTWFGHIGANVCVMDLPLAWCEQNIEAHPGCTATLEQLDDCMESVRSWPGDAPGWVGHGCGPFVSNATCEGLIVQVLPENAAPTDCKVAVE